MFAVSTIFESSASFIIVFSASSSKYFINKLKSTGPNGALQYATWHFAPVWHGAIEG